MGDDSYEASCVREHEAMRYRQEVAGRWVYPKRTGYRMMCCDCGLVHVLDFKVAKDSIGRAKILFRVFRNERATAAARKRFRKPA